MEYLFPKSYAILLVYLLRKKCHAKRVQIRRFFWSIFSHIRTEYSDLSLIARIRNDILYLV